MPLPIRTTLEDVHAVTRYLATKPTGATASEAGKVLDAKFVDARKLSALKRWNLIHDDGGRLKLTTDGRALAKDPDAGQRRVLQSVIRRVAPYNSILERAFHAGDKSLSATEVGSYWHDHFKNEVGESEKILNDSAVCFFQVVEGAGLGKVVIGRKGLPTRLDLNHEMLGPFCEGSEGSQTPDESDEVPSEPDDGSEAAENERLTSRGPTVISPNQADQRNKRVFVTHGKNRSFLEPLKDLLGFGEFEPVISVERESVAVPVPDKVMEDMRSCGAAIIHVDGEQELTDATGKTVTMINPNVLVEIGAAMALYGHRFILLVQEGMKLPTNLQGLYEVRYKGASLDAEATIRLLKAIRDIKTRPLPEVAPPQRV